MPDRLIGILPKIVRYGRSSPKLQTAKSWTVCVDTSLQINYHANVSIGEDLSVYFSARLDHN